MNLDYFKNVGKEHNEQHDTTRTLTDLIPTQKMIKADIDYDIWSAKVDYQSVVWQRFLLESGAKWALSMTDNNSSELESFKPDLITEFTYLEQIGAAYVSLAGQLGPKWSFKAGLRGEYTYSFGDWISAGDQTKRSYFDLFPTVFVGFNPNEKWRFSTSFSRRINRPGYSQLNPTKTFIDAKTYVMGNPDILPEYSNDLTASVGYGQYLGIAMGTMHSNNSINQIPSYEDGISYMTWDNYGTTRINYLALSVSALPVTKWLQWSMTPTCVNIKSTIKNSNVVKNYTSFQGYTSLSFILPKDWRIDLDANGAGPMIMGSYKIHAYAVSNFAAKKTLLDGKMTLTLKLDDIFRTMKTDIEILDDFNTGYTSEILQRFCTQKLLIDLTWNFGTQHQTKQRKVGNMDELSRAGRSGLGGN